MSLTISKTVRAKYSTEYKSFGQAARRSFDGEGGGQGALQAGTYSPLTAPALEIAVARRGGDNYGALVFTKDGEEFKITSSSIRNAVRVLTQTDNLDALAGTKWKGDEAQPTKWGFRYGRSNGLCETSDELLPDGSVNAWYNVSPFTLAEKRAYLVPEFVEGDDGRRHPDYKNATIRVAMFVADAEL